MLRFTVGGRSAGIASPAVGDGLATLWNPSGTVTLYVVEIRAVASGLNANLSTLNTRRATVRGTPGSTVTPDIDCNYQRLITPPSGALLDLANYSVEPTLDASVLEADGVGPFGGGGYAWVYATGVAVPPGTGLCLASATTGGLESSDVVYVWDE